MPSNSFGCDDGKKLPNDDKAISYHYTTVFFNNS